MRFEKVIMFYVVKMNSFVKFLYQKDAFGFI